MNYIYFLLTDLKIGWKFILFYLPEKSDRFWWQQTLQINWMIQLMHWVLLSALLQKALRVTKMEYNQTPMKIQSWTLWGSSAAYTCKYFTNLIHKVIMWMQILNWNLEKKNPLYQRSFTLKKYIYIHRSCFQPPRCGLASFLSISSGAPPRLVWNFLIIFTFYYSKNLNIKQN